MPTKPPLLHLRRRHPTLRTLGFAVQYFPNFINPRRVQHSLDVVLLTCIIRGSGAHIMDDEEFTDRGSSLAVTHYGQAHVIQTDSNGMDIYNIYLDLERHALPGLPTGLRKVLPDLLPLHPRFAHVLNRRVRIQFPDPRPMEALLARMLHEQQTQPPGWEDVMRRCFRILLIDACRQALASGLQPSVRAASPGTPWLERIRRKLDETYHHDHRLDALAASSRVSPGHLSRAFHRYTGQRLIDYLIQRRIRAAMVELRSSDAKILHVALQCGFHDLRYFNRKFLQIVGVTPTTYRHQPPLNPKAPRTRFASPR